MKEKSNPVFEFNDAEWVCDLAFLVNNIFSFQLINCMFDHIKAVLVKLSLWEKQINNKNFVHFPTLLSCKNQNTQKYATLMSQAIKEFTNRLQGFKKKR